MLPSAALGALLPALLGDVVGAAEQHAALHCPRRLVDSRGKAFYFDLARGVYVHGEYTYTGGHLAGRMHGQDLMPIAEEVRTQ